MNVKFWWIDKYELTVNIRFDFIINWENLYNLKEKKTGRVLKVEYLLYVSTDAAYNKEINLSMDVGEKRHLRNHISITYTGIKESKTPRGE